MKDVMLDLETWATDSNAAIVQIGACYFDRKTGEVGKTFKVNVDPSTSTKAGGNINPATILWWMSQSQEAIKSITGSPQKTINDAMIDLNSFLSEAKYVWSHATFDFPIIMSTFDRLGIKPNISYRSARDIRTLTDLARVSKDDYKGIIRDGTHHDALSDCLYQVKYCVLALKALE